MFLPASSFRRAPPSGRWEALFRGPVGGGQVLGPRRPGPVSDLTAAASEAGVVTLTFSPPLDAGDGPVRDDGLGVITGHQVSIAFGSWASVGAAGGTFSFPGLIGDVIRVRALGYAGRTGQVSTLQADAWSPPAAAGPGAPAWFVLPGAASGEIEVTILAAPGSAGDGPSWGDGLGAITGYQISVAGGAWADYGPTLPRVVVSGGHAPGALVAVSVRALGHEGRPGSAALGSAVAATVAPAEPITDAVSGEPITDAVSGEIITDGYGAVAPPTMLRAASVGADWVIASGHSLTDAWAFNGAGFGGCWLAIRNSLFAGAGGNRKHTVAGSALVWRWNNRQEPGDPDIVADSRTDIEDFDLLVITEAGPPRRPDVPTDRPDFAVSLNMLFNFAENAHLNGRAGGAETILHTINTYTTGVESWGMDAPEALVEYERVFHFMADHAAARMRREHGLPADYRIWVLPFHRLWMRVWADLGTSSIPTISVIEDLYLAPPDTIHPNETATYGLACLAAAMIYQVNPAETPGFYVPAGYNAALRDYWWSVAWEIATTYQRAGMGGSIVGEPGYVHGVDLDPTATPVSVATAPGISPSSGDVGTVYTLTLATWAGTAPITSGWSLTLDGVDVTDDVVATGGVLTWTAPATGALVLTCTADNNAHDEAEAQASVYVGSALPEDALAVVTAEGSTGVTWSPALPAASGGYRTLTAEHTQGTLTDPAVYMIAVYRVPAAPGTGVTDPLLALHEVAGGMWWAGDTAMLTVNGWTQSQGMGAAAGGDDYAGWGIGSMTTDWRVLELTVAGDTVTGRRDGVATEPASVTTPRALDPLGYVSLWTNATHMPASHLAALLVMGRIPDAGELTAIRAWAAGIQGDL